MIRTEALNPAQQDVLDLLGAPPDQRPSFDPHLRRQLHDDLEEALAPLTDFLPADDTLFVGKRQLTQVLGCQTRYLAQLDDEFAWSIPLARGTLTHRTIELSVHWRGEDTPLAMVDEIIAKAELGEDTMARWIQGLDEAERAELRSEVSNRVTAFLECWPPLKREWRPSMEAPVRVEVAGGRIVLSGKVDLVLGRAAGNVAGKVLVDLKTGRLAAAHRDDLRYYALLDTIRIGTPPRLVATYYLDQGRFTPEPVTVAMLESTIARIVDAVRRIVDIRYRGAAPTLQPGPGCRWCSRLELCDDGSAFVRQDDEAHDLP